MLPYINYIYKQPLKGAPNMCSLKHGKPDTLNSTNDSEIRTHYNDREDQDHHHHLHHHHMTMSLHALKISYQPDFQPVCCRDLRR